MASIPFDDHPGPDILLLCDRIVLAAATTHYPFANDVFEIMRDLK
jgi:hypothetical protein